MTPPPPVNPPPSPAAPESVWWKAALILLAGLFVYAPVFQGGWLIDDNYELTENFAVQSPQGLGLIWRGQAGADYLPLKSTVQWVMWRFVTADPGAFHRLSIGLHLLSALLLWRLLWRLGLRHAWLGGLLLVADPIFVQSVAWVSELKNTLSLAVLLLAALAWVAFEARGRGRDYAGALVGFAAALLCKSSVVMWPAVLLLYAWFRRDRIGWRDLARTAPFFALSLAAAVTTVLLQTERSIGGETYPVGGVASRAALIGLNLAFYLWKTLVPFGLSPMYPQWRIDPPSLLQFLPWPLLAAAGWLLWTRRGTAWGRAAGFGLGFFVVTLVPVLGFFKMSYWRIAWASDHLVYLPAVGIVGLAAAGAGHWYDRSDGWTRQTLVAAGFLGLGLLVFASHRYAYVYADMESLCLRAIQRDPHAWLAHQLYAVARQEKGDVPTAYKHAQAAVDQRPDTAETQNTLGTTLLILHKPAEASEHFKKAIKLAPGQWKCRVNLAKCFVELRDFGQALTQYQWLSQFAPENVSFHCNVGVCLYQVGRLDEAVAEFRRALELDPRSREAAESLAALQKARGGSSL